MARERKSRLQLRSALGERITRRQVLHTATVSGAGLTAAALLACGGEQKPAAMPGSEAKQPRRGGSLTRTASGDMEDRPLDPHITPTTPTRAWSIVYQGLIRYGAQSLEIDRELARAWEQPSETEYVFSLQPGVKWHNKPPVNGRPLSADDVAWSLERVRTPEPLFQNRSLLASIDRIETVDQATVWITTKRPDATTLSNLAAETVAVLAPEAVEKFPKMTTADTMIGTGPFILKAREATVAAEYIRNPDYWKPGLPYLDSLLTRYFSDDQTEWAAFLAGQLDVAIVPGTEAKRYLHDWSSVRAVWLDV